MTTRFTLPALLIALGLALPALAQDDPRAAVEEGLRTITRAVLSGDPALAADRFAPGLALISQSGKLYGRADALADLGSGFRDWSNEAVVIRPIGDVIAVTLVNRRQRLAGPPGAYRVTQLWSEGPDGKWWIEIQHSTRIAE